MFKSVFSVGLFLYVSPCLFTEGMQRLKFYRAKTFSKRVGMEKDCMRVHLHTKKVKREGQCHHISHTGAPFIAPVFKCPFPFLQTLKRGPFKGNFTEHEVGRGGQKCPLRLIY